MDMDQSQMLNILKNKNHPAMQWAARMLERHIQTLGMMQRTDPDTTILSDLEEVHMSIVAALNTGDSSELKAQVRIHSNDIQALFQMQKPGAVLMQLALPHVSEEDRDLGARLAICFSFGFTITQTALLFSELNSIL